MEEKMDGITAVAIATGFGLALAAFGGALGQGKATAAALEGMARQPEAAGDIRTTMIIGLALIESLVIYVLLIAFFLNGHLGTLVEAATATKATAAATAPEAPADSAEEGGT
jgi:F-type H+-transporting ATPase subunit c